MTPKAIVQTAKNELVNVITTTLRKLDGFYATGKKNLVTSPEDSILVPAIACKSATPKVSIEVNNPYLGKDEAAFTYLPIEKFVLCHGEFYVEAHDLKFFPKDLPLEELANIAIFLQAEFENCK